MRLGVYLFLMVISRQEPYCYLGVAE